MLTPIAPPNHWPTLTTSSTSVTLGAGDATVLCSNTSDATVSLPSAATVPGQIFAVKKIGNNAHTVTLAPNGSETIDGATTYVLYVVGDYVVIQSDGTAWRVIGGYLARHVAVYEKASSQSIASSVTKVALDSITTNIGGLVDAANSRIIIRRSGLYLIDGYFEAPGAGFFARCWLYINGSQSRRGNTSADNSTRAQVVCETLLDAGDYVELYGARNSGTGISTAPRERPMLSVMEVR